MDAGAPLLDGSIRVKDHKVAGEGREVKMTTTTTLRAAITEAGFQAGGPTLVVAGPVTLGPGSDHVILTDLDASLHEKGVKEGHVLRIIPPQLRGAVLKASRKYKRWKIAGLTLTGSSAANGIAAGTMAWIGISVWPLLIPAGVCAVAGGASAGGAMIADHKRNKHMNTLLRVCA